MLNGGPFFPVLPLHCTSRTVSGEHLLPGLVHRPPDGLPTTSVCSPHCLLPEVSSGTRKKKCYFTLLIKNNENVLNLFFFCFVLNHTSTNNPMKAIGPFWVKRTLYTLLIIFWHCLSGISNICHQLVFSPDIPWFIYPIIYTLAPLNFLLFLNFEMFFKFSVLSILLIAWDTKLKQRKALWCVCHRQPMIQTSLYKLENST